MKKRFYAIETEEAMQMFAATLNERDFRRYAAVEALKLEHGGIKYISRLLNIVWFNGGRVRESVNTLMPQSY